MKKLVPSAFEIVVVGVVVHVFCCDYSWSEVRFDSIQLLMGVETEKGGIGRGPLYRYCGPISLPRFPLLLDREDKKSLPK